MDLVARRLMREPTPAMVDSVKDLLDDGVRLSLAGPIKKEHVFRRLALFTESADPNGQGKIMELLQRLAKERKIEGESPFIGPIYQADVGLQIELSGNRKFSNFTDVQYEPPIIIRGDTEQATDLLMTQVDAKDNPLFKVMAETKTSLPYDELSKDGRKLSRQLSRYEKILEADAKAIRTDRIRRLDIRYGKGGVPEWLRLRVRQINNRIKLNQDLPIATDDFVTFKPTAPSVELIPDFPRRQAGPYPPTPPRKPRGSAIPGQLKYVTYCPIIISSTNFVSRSRMTSMSTSPSRVSPSRVAALVRN